MLRYTNKTSGTKDRSGQLLGGKCLMASHEHVVAIIVTFRPSRQLLDNVAALLEQVQYLIVVDNGSTGDSLDLIREIEVAFPRTTVVFNRLNKGIATALNQGLTTALEMGFEWLITFDQDSTVTPGMVAMLRRCFSGQDNVAIAAPNYIDRELGTRLGQDREESGEIRTVLSSGMMVPAWLLVQIGLMNEALFIDGVDWEFCQRVRASGYRIVQCEEACLLHSLGKTTSFRLLGRRFEATNHSAARKYYQMRNRLWILGRPRLDKAWWKQGCREARDLGWDTIKVILVEKDKIRKLFRITQGAFDGLMNRMGKRIDL